MEAKKFKKSVFGGFNKTEVIRYIDELQKQSAQKAESEEVTRLREENARLTEALRKTDEQLRKFASPVANSNTMLASSLAHSKAHFENITAIVNGICETTGESVTNANANIIELINMADCTSKDFAQSVEALRENLQKLQAFLNETSDCLMSASANCETASENVSDSENKTMEILKKGEVVADDIKKQQEENSKLLHVVN